MMTERDYLVGMQFEIDGVKDKFKRWYTIAEITVVIGILTTSLFGIHIIYSAIASVAAFALSKYVRNIIAQNALILWNINCERICVDTTYESGSVKWLEVDVVVVSETHVNIITKKRGQITARLKNVKGHEALLECLRAFSGGRYYTEEEYQKILKAAAKMIDKLKKQA